MRYHQSFTNSSKPRSSLQARKQTQAQPFIYTGSGVNLGTTSACINSSPTQRLNTPLTEEMAGSQSQQRHQGQNPRVTPVLLSAHCVFPHCTGASPCDRVPWQNTGRGVRAYAKLNHIKSNQTSLHIPGWSRNCSTEEWFNTNGNTTSNINSRKKRVKGISLIYERQNIGTFLTDLNTTL